MNTLLAFGGITLASLLALAGLLHLIPKLGPPGKRLASACIQAPGLDLIVAAFTMAPMIAGLAVGQATLGGWYGWAVGLAVGVAAQALTVLVWSRLHELAHREAMRGPRIARTLNKKFGSAQNAAAVWSTTVAVPVFSAIRLAEIVAYPALTRLVGFPRYNSGEWVCVSRQKFEGLVGRDLIWCLYCDWMTGVWSLGSEMLRNVESFWCPIKFYSGKKCDNCSVDFPDIAGGWVSPDADMTAVVAVLDDKYPGPGGVNAWFGHPVRLTREGEQIEETDSSDAPGSGSSS